MESRINVRKEIDAQRLARHEAEQKAKAERLAANRPLTTATHVLSRVR